MTRQEWLDARNLPEYQGIGASEAAIICGYSPWMKSSELWEIKTGARQQKDISDNESVSYGTHAEEHIRQLFMLKHPELTLEYHPYMFLFQSENPWLRSTLDGELIDSDGRRGILEIKSASCSKKSDWEKWNGHIPDYYFCQIVHQFLSTGFDFAYLSAELIAPNLDSEIRNYYFEWDDVKDSATYLFDEEQRFMKSVKTGKIPTTTLRL